MMSDRGEYRSLGGTGIQVSAVAMGCWPIAGMTSLGVNEADSVATLQTALDHGVNFFDTAYCYGRDGESERRIARALGHRRDEIVIATKGGIHYDPQGKRLLDARPETLRRECDESLRRLGTDRVDLLFLHAPDPEIPLADSAGALRDLMAAGKTRSVGASNLTLPQLEAFHAICPVAAFQPAYNMLQRQIERDVLPWCLQHGVALVVYWPLLKGLLAGQLPRDYVFPPSDGRAKYVMFQGEEWQKNQDFVDCLREIARDIGKTVAQVAINWTIHQHGITAALCGAKRPYQIIESAGGMGWLLDGPSLERIAAALAARGEPATQPAV
ncbi:MAG TPA: aldo/keto reductase [Candidatus Anammoximicrobium sp.]|nr:aldo/keto reductase [Candidatus Anammoximicrobium sp.]